MAGNKKKKVGPHGGTRLQHEILEQMHGKEPNAKSLAQAMIRLGVAPIQFRYTYDDTAKALGCSVEQVRNLVRTGALASVTDEAAKLPEGAEEHRVVSPRHITASNGTEHLPRRGRTYSRFVTWDGLVEFLAKHGSFAGWKKWKDAVAPPGVYRTCPTDQGGCGLVRRMDQYTRYGENRKLIYPVCVICQADSWVTPPIDIRLQAAPRSWLITQAKETGYGRRVLHEINRVMPVDDAANWARSLGFLVGQQVGGRPAPNVPPRAPELWLFANPDYDPKAVYGPD